MGWAHDVTLEIAASSTGAALVPEPSSLLLLGVASATLMAVGVRKEIGAGRPCGWRVSRMCPAPCRSASPKLKPRRWDHQSLVPS